MGVAESGATSHLALILLQVGKIEEPVASELPVLWRFVKQRPASRNYPLPDPALRGPPR